jgi:hypothetical protein
MPKHLRSYRPFNVDHDVVRTEFMARGLVYGPDVDFEVVHNLVSDSDKEGIDIKETSAHGRVHPNLVHHLRRQGIYVDAWFGQIDDIEIVDNVVHDCHGSGIALSVENGTLVDGITIRRNLVFGNDGSGLYFFALGRQQSVAPHHHRK